MTHPLRFETETRGTPSVPSRFGSKLPQLCSRSHIPMTRNINTRYPMHKDEIITLKDAATVDTYYAGLG